MYKLISLWNQNRKTFAFVIAIIVAIIILIQVLNQMAKNDLKKSNENQNSYAKEDSTIIEKSANTAQTDSIVSGTKITENEADENQAIIKSFVEYCNNGKVEEAYNLISDECKQNVLNTVSDFKSKYIDVVFTSKKDYNLQNWYKSELGVTYKITYLNGSLISTGKVESNIEDYITVNKGKLNIYRYIGNVQENKQSSSDVINVQVIDREIYDEYELYNLKVQNLSKNTIMINRHADNGGIYVSYNNDLNCSALISNTYSGNLELEKNQTKYISIKINKMYNGNYKAKKLIFKDIIKNKQEFDKNSQNYTDISTLEIEL